jgi:hypothetical protein
MSAHSPTLIDIVNAIARAAACQHTGRPVTIIDLDAHQARPVYYCASCRTIKDDQGEPLWNYATEAARAQLESDRADADHIVLSQSFEPINRLEKADGTGSEMLRDPDPIAYGEMKAEHFNRAPFDDSPATGAKPARLRRQLATEDAYDRAARDRKLRERMASDAWQRFAIFSHRRFPEFRAWLRAQGIRMRCPD